jgi:hypothetical protein
MEVDPDDARKPKMRAWREFGGLRRGMAGREDLDGIATGIAELGRSSRIFPSHLVAAGMREHRLTAGSVNPSDRLREVAH